MPSVILTTKSAAAIAGVTYGTICKWCADGKLPYIRPGGAFLVYRADLDVFLAKPRKRPGQYDRSKLKKRRKP